MAGLKIDKLRVTSKISAQCSRDRAIKAGLGHVLPQSLIESNIYFKLISFY